MIISAQLYFYIEVVGTDRFILLSFCPMYYYFTFSVLCFLFLHSEYLYKAQLQKQNKIYKNVGLLVHFLIRFYKHVSVHGNPIQLGSKDDCMATNATKAQQLQKEWPSIHTATLCRMDGSHIPHSGASQWLKP